MVPQVAVAASALATRLTAVARAAAPTMSALIARLRATGATVGDKVDDVIAFAKASPGNAAMVAVTLGTLGVQVADLFHSEEGKALATKAQNGQIDLADYVRIDAAGAASTKLDLQIAETAVDAQTAIQILRYAKAHFGSAHAAMDGHRMMQAFFEMPRDDVVAGYATLRV